MRVTETMEQKLVQKSREVRDEFLIDKYFDAIPFESISIHDSSVCLSWYILISYPAPLWAIIYNNFSLYHSRLIIHDRERRSGIRSRVIVTNSFQYGITSNAVFIDLSCLVRGNVAIRYYKLIIYSFCAAHHVSFSSLFVVYRAQHLVIC